MKKIITFFIAALTLCVVQVGNAQIITFSFSGQTGSQTSQTASTVATGITSATLTRSGLGANAGSNSFNSNAWNTAANHVKITVVPSATYTLSISNVSITLASSGTGPSTYTLKSSADNYAASVSLTAGTNNNVSLAALGISNENTTIELRLFGSGASGASGTGRINALTFAGSSTLAPLPVSFTGFNAYQKNTVVGVDWSVATETGIAAYELERSADAASFIKINTTAAKNISNSKYTVFDNSPLQGLNYYRIKSISMNGDVKYTAIVKVNMSKQATTSLHVYPNPVKNHVINLSLNNIEKGSYVISLINNTGLQVTNKTIIHNGENSTQSIYIPGNLAKGIYLLKLSGKTNLVQQVIID